MIIQTIKNKLDIKCKNDKVMHDFLTALLEKEDEGGQHTKTYKQEIEKAVKEKK